MAELTNKQRARVYGKLVVDFANAKTTDEAYFHLIQGMKDAFGFSQEFVETSKSAFPSLSRFIESLNLESKHEKALLNHICAELRLRWFLNERFIRLNVLIEDYDSSAQTLKLRGIHGGLSEMHISEIADKWRVELPIETYWEVRKLFRIGNKILRFKNYVSDSRYPQIDRFVDYYNKLISINKRLRETQRKTREGLADLVAGKKLPESEALHHFLELYPLAKFRLVFDSDDSFRYEANIFLNEDSFRGRLHADEEYPKTEEDEPWLTDPWLTACWETYREVITYCIVEFLRYDDPARIKRCSLCSRFHIRKKRQEEKNYLCSPRCHDLFFGEIKKKDKYMTRYMKEWRERNKL